VKIFNKTQCVLNAFFYKLDQIFFGNHLVAFKETL